MPVGPAESSVPSVFPSRRRSTRPGPSRLQSPPPWATRSRAGKSPFGLTAPRFRRLSAPFSGKAATVSSCHGDMAWDWKSKSPSNSVGCPSVTPPRRRRRRASPALSRQSIWVSKQSMVDWPKGANPRSLYFWPIVSTTPATPSARSFLKQYCRNSWRKMYRSAPGARPVGRVSRAIRSQIHAFR